MLKYRIVKQKNALDTDKAEMYFPRLTSRTKYDLHDVADMISQRSTLNKADIIATLISLEEVIPEFLKSGSIVDLGRLGTFSIQAKAETSPTKEESPGAVLKMYGRNSVPGKP